MITRVSIVNYTSIKSCSVELGPLTFLVGPNGAGKSNFLRALNLLSVGLRTTLNQAVFGNGAFSPFQHFQWPTTELRVDFATQEFTGHYAFKFSQNRPRLTVNREECVLNNGSFFRVANGVVIESSLASPPRAAEDRLYLINTSGLREFRAVYDLLSRVVIYNPWPDSIRNPERVQRPELLDSVGNNLSTVYADMPEEAQQSLLGTLQLVIPHLSHIQVGEDHRIFFSFSNAREGQRTILGPENVSDGTLRLFALLVALEQTASDGQHPSLIAMEEPDAGLHPAAIGVLLDEIREASTYTQVIATSHSPELLDNKDIASDWILAVAADENGTHIGRIDEVGRSVLRDHLFTAGEMLRMNQLKLDLDDPRVNEPVRIFDESCVN